MRCGKIRNCIQQMQNNLEGRAGEGGRGHDNGRGISIHDHRWGPGPVRTKPKPKTDGHGVEGQGKAELLACYCSQLALNVGKVQVLIRWRQVHCPLPESHPRVEEDNAPIRVDGRTP